MNDLEKAIWKSCKEADKQFEAAGAAGTKTWVRNYFLPALERNNVKIYLKEDEEEKEP